MSKDPGKLAIDGGQPVRTAVLPYGRHDITAEDRAAVDEVLRSDWLTTGPRVAQFEQAFARQVGAAHAVAVNSGTAALHCAVAAAGIGPGDEVITSPLTFAATSNAVLYCGGTPVFADVDPVTLNLDVAQVEAKLTPRTKAVIPVHFTGLPAPMERFGALAAKRGFSVIADACHALGASLASRPIAAHASQSCFSLHPVKHITSGEGGVVATDDAGLAARARRFRNHGIDTDVRQRAVSGQWRYEMLELGFNYRVSDIGCALALSQLSRLEAQIARRNEIARQYTERLAPLALRLPAPGDGAVHAWHLYVVRLELDRLSADRDRVFHALRAEGLGVNVHYGLVYHHPYYRQRFAIPDGTCPVAEDAAARCLTLPLFPTMTDRDVDDVVAALTKVLAAYAR